MKKHYLLAAATGLLALSAVPAMAFHDGGVANCAGCHSMHNGAENAASVKITAADGTFTTVAAAPTENLLKGSDASSTCLNCHQGTVGSYHVLSTLANNVKEGGEFGWLKKQYMAGRTGTTPYAGNNAGHNIIAADFGLVVDPTNATAPGSTLNYDSLLLGCTSCHDAHGQVMDGTAGGGKPAEVSGSYGDPIDPAETKANFRLLGDSMYEAGGKDNDNFAFSNDAPIALASSSAGLKTRYGSGMSEWCANCHDAYYNNTPDADLSKHPTSVPLADNGYDVNYNAYVATGDFTGVQATAYNDMVPFETGAVDQADLITATVNTTAGPVAGAQVMCLSCHRAHASAFNNAGRWDFTASLLAESANYTTVTDISGTVPYYADGVAVDMSANAEQRSLCNKCHVQD
jgi:hypothetical protein